jgi:hypothetical protein
VLGPDQTILRDVPGLTARVYSPRPSGQAVQGRRVRVRDPRVLRECILLSGLSEREFAQRAGVSHSTLNHLLTGRRVTCSRETAWAIEQTLRQLPGLFFDIG